MSFNLCIIKITHTLNLIKKGYVFDETGKLVRQTSCSNVLAKSTVLKNFFQELNHAPTYYVNASLCCQFKKSLAIYLNSDSNRKNEEAQKIDKIAENILNLVEVKLNEVKSFFQSEEAKEINAILDKNSISNEEHRLLLFLANFLALNRISMHLFYAQSAHIEKIQRLLRQFPKVKIAFPEIGIWQPSILSNFEEFEVEEMLLVLQIEMLYQNEPQIFSLPNFKFLKLIIEKKLTTRSPAFKEYVDSFLALHAISEICTTKWDCLNKDKQVVLKELQNFIDDHRHLNKTLNPYVRQFIYQPSIYQKLTEGKENLSPFEIEENYGKVALELFSLFSRIDPPRDVWYQGIYNKLTDHQKNHPEALLPIVPIKAFLSQKDFTDYNDIKLKISEKLEALENEVKIEIELKNRSLKTPVKALDKKLPSLTPQKISTDLPVKSENGCEKPVELELSKTLELTPSPTPPEKKMEESKVVIPSSDMLEKSAPFKVHKRVLKCFIEPNSIKKRTSLLIHRFAWAANEIAWLYGFFHERDNGKGVKQPALGMLCQLEHALYPKGNLFRLTITFDYSLKKGEKLERNPNLICYHRTLTRKEQASEELEAFITDSRYHFIDFPPLPSQSFDIKIREDLLSKIYPDGSYIEKVKGGVVTLRDPQNDVGSNKCRLHLFLTRQKFD